MDQRKKVLKGFLEAEADPEKLRKVRQFEASERRLRKKKWKYEYDKNEMDFL